MPTLSNYQHFAGEYWETAAIRNALAYAGVTAPHTQQPLSEALLLGISGGIVAGYFSFAYEGHEPHVALLTRNTFDPMEAIFTRLAIPRDVYQTSNATTAVQNLITILERGDAPLVWADIFCLPYNTLSYTEDIWAMMPIIVYGYDEPNETAHIADRASVGLTVTTAELARARGRVKRDKFRAVVLGAPDMDKLVSAVQKGIFDCLKIYTEEPPKGSKNNFGLIGLQHWAKVVINPKMNNSWAKVFPRGEKLYGGLRTTFENIEIFGKSVSADRETYAQFLDEASVLLTKPGLTEVADLFRTAGTHWTALGEAVLPDSVPALQEARLLLVQHRDLFRQTGHANLPELRRMQIRLRAIKASMSQDFPLSEAETDDLLQNVHAHILRIYDAEKIAVTALQDIMAKN